MCSFVKRFFFPIDCECDTPGVKKENNVYIGTCELVTGQCECATDAIFGRRCEECARGTKSRCHCNSMLGLLSRYAFSRNNNTPEKRQIHVIQ